MKGEGTAPHPMKPVWIEEKLKGYGFETVHKSGVSVFSDYVGMKRGCHESDEEVVPMELRHSNQEAYINMGVTYTLCGQESYPGETR